MASTIGLRAVIDLSQFNKGVKQYNSSITGMNKETSSFSSSASGSLSKLGGSIVSIGATAAKVAAGGVAVLAGALTTFAIGGIKQATSLDQQMADIASVMGKTKDAVTPLKQEILDLSLDPQLRVNATEAATAVELLARNGLTMTDIMDGAAKSTVALANATRADFGVAADVATDVMAIFNIQAKDMGRAIDGITGVTTNSKLTIDDYALALASVGAVGQGMGLSLEDMNTVLAATASSFSSGRVAGTSLKVLLQRLAKPTDEMQQAMDKYGISLFDSEGNMRSMAEIANQLNGVFQGTATITETVGGATAEQAKLAQNAASKIDDLQKSIANNQAQLQLYNDELQLQIQYYGEGSPKVRQRQIQIQKLTDTIGKQTRELGKYEDAVYAVENSQAKQISKTVELTEAEKANLAAVLGGADGARQIIALSKLTGDEFDALSSKVNAEGQALRAAATRVDSLQGAWDIFKSVIQAVQIQVGDKFLPVLRSVTVGVTDLATKYGPKLIDFFGNIANKIVGLVSRFKGLADLFKSGGLQALLTGGFIGEVGWGGVQVEGLLDILGLSPENQAIALDVINRIIAGVKNVGNAISALMVGNTSGFLTALGLTPEMANQIMTIGNNIVSTITTVIGMIISAFSALRTGDTSGFLTALGLTPEVASQIITIGQNIIATITTIIGAITTAISSLMTGDAGGFLLAIGLTPETAATILTIGEVIKGVFAGIVAVVMQSFGSLQGSFAKITEILNGFGLTWGDVFTALGQATGIVLAAIGALIVGLVGIVVGAFNGIAVAIDALIQVFQFVWDGVQRAIEGIAKQFVGWQMIIDNFGSDWSAVWDGVVLVFQGAVDLMVGLGQALLGAISVPFVAISTFIGGWVEGIITFFTTLYDTLVGNSIIPDLVNGIISWFNFLTEPILTVLDTISGAISTVLGPLLSLFSGGGAEGGTGFSLANLIAEFPVATEAANLFYENLTLQTTAFLEGAWLTLETRFNNLIIITLPQLQMVYTTVFQQMISVTLQLISIVMQLVNLIIMIGTEVKKAGKAVKEATKEMGEGFADAADEIESKLFPALEETMKKLERIEYLARNAAGAISQIAGGTSPSAVGNSDGVGLSKGIGLANGLGLGFTVPPGFNNDSFGPLYVQSGEEMLVTPRGTSIESLVFSRLSALLSGSVRGGSVNGGKSVQVNFNAPISISSGMDWDTFQSGVKRTVAGAF